MNWFDKKIKKFENDPQYIAELRFLKFTEAICRIKQPKGFYKLLFIIMDYIALLLIYRRKTNV